MLLGPFVSQVGIMITLLLTEREGRTGEYWPEVVVVQTERSEVRTKTTEGQYSPVRLELARLVSSLLYGTRTMLALSLPAFENKKYTAYDRFHGNGPYGEIPTEKEPIRTLGLTMPYNNILYTRLVRYHCYEHALVIYGKIFVYQHCFCYLNVQNVKQRNSLFHQAIVLWLEY